jgi:hypothetical protein
VDTEGLSHKRFELLRRLTVKAGQAAQRIAEGTQGFTDTQWVRAVVQCTRDLPASECTRCLSHYTDQLPRLFPNNSGGAIKGTSCYLRYAVLADKPRRVRLERYLYSEDYEERKNKREREIAEERKEQRRKVTVIISIVTVAVALVLCLLVLLIRFVLYRWRRWLAVARAARRSYLEKLPKQAAYYRGKSVCEDELEKGTGPR